jgi:dTDP-4-dehydrorhamnose reductase
MHTLHQILAPTRSELNLFDDQACKKYLSKELPDYVIHSAVDINSVENTLRIFFNIYN